MQPVEVDLYASSGRRLAIAFLLTLSVFSASLVLHLQVAQAYSCGNGTSGHCYGLVDWYGPSNGYLNGSETTISIESISCHPCDQFIDNEMWLNDYYSSQASKCNDGNCWVEAGYLADNNAGNCVQAYALCYFWADNRPGGGFHEHNRLLPSDDIGTNTQFIIERDQYNSSY